MRDRRFCASAPGIAAVLVLAVLAAYLPALRSGFIWDDDAHVTRSGLRSLSGLGRIWFQPGATQQYYPVVHSAFWVEHRLWGDAPLGYHLVNVLLHAANACLLVSVLSRITRPIVERGGASRPALPPKDIALWAAGFLFALHPVCVESVAWVSEQKNTLSALFYLLAALLYLDWFQGRAGTPTPPGTSLRPESNAQPGGDIVPALPSKASYWLATALFLLALLSKSVTATLPAALLVVLWWKHGRLSWKRDVVPLLPWFALALAAGLFTAWIERTFIGAQGAPFALSAVQRMALSGRIAWFYLGKFVWPADLAFIYPRWAIGAPSLASFLPVAGLLALLAAAWFWARSGKGDLRRRAPLAALLLFFGALFPALGFFNVYPFLFSYVADHFQYLACLAGCGAIGLAVERWSASGPTRFPTPVGAAVLIFLGATSFRQCRIYRDAETLYRDTLARNPGCWLAELNLANLRLADGRVDEAVARYRRAEALEPGYPSTHFNLGRVLLQAGDGNGAVGEFAAAARIDPADFQARENLGIALARTNRLGEAESQIREAIRLRPADARARLNLGTVLFQEGRGPAAAAEYRQAIALAPGTAEAAAARENLARLQGHGQEQSRP